MPVYDCTRLAPHEPCFAFNSECRGCCCSVYHAIYAIYAISMESRKKSAQKLRRAMLDGQSSSKKPEPWPENFDAADVLSPMLSRFYENFGRELRRSEVSCRSLSRLIRHYAPVRRPADRCARAPLPRRRRAWAPSTAVAPATAVSSHPHDESCARGSTHMPRR